MRMVIAMNNLVAKHARKFNKAHTMVDRKKNLKRGVYKYKTITIN